MAQWRTGDDARGNEGSANVAALVAAWERAASSYTTFSTDGGAAFEQFERPLEAHAAG